MLPPMFIGLGLSGLIILLFGKSPAPKPPASADKPIATVVLSGSTGELVIVEKKSQT